MHGYHADIEKITLRNEYFCEVLFTCGTGSISSGSAALAVERGIDLTLLNRGQSVRTPPAGARVLHANIRDRSAVQDALVRVAGGGDGGGGVGFSGHRTSRVKLGEAIEYK